jgi:hypothetical protein
VKPNISTIVLLIILIIAGIGYYFFREPAKPPPPSASSIDSIAAPDKTVITAPEDSIPPPPPPKERYSPGTAFVRALVTSIDSSEGQPSQIDIQIEEVIGYGASTPPLPVGTKLTFSVQNYLEANPEYQELVQKDAEIKMIIASQQGGVGQKGEGKQRWSFVEFKQ